MLLLISLIRLINLFQHRMYLPLLYLTSEPAYIWYTQAWETRNVTWMILDSWDFFFPGFCTTFFFLITWGQKWIIRWLLCLCKNPENDGAVCVLDIHLLVPKSFDSQFKCRNMYEWPNCGSYLLSPFLPWWVSSESAFWTFLSRSELEK